MIKDLDYKIWFATLKLPDRVKLMLLENLQSEEEIYNNRKTLSKINEKYLNIIQSDLENQMTYRIKNDINKGQYNIVIYSDENYPKSLKDIPDAPYILFYKGEIDNLNSQKSLSIVGSRKCSEYGKEVAKYIAGEIGKYSVNVISGGALGIDTVVHETCIKHDYYNAAILGCGINICYPSYNRNLYDKLTNCGTIITEFIPDVKPLSYNFPKRNRIISGLSTGIIVVEAGEKSGSLITCSLALEQGKDVVAVPGSIFSPQSKGCNKLIKDGAIIFTNIEDMLYNLAIDYKKEKHHECNGFKEIILKLLEEKIMHIDEIIRVVNIDTGIIHELLCELQFENEITNIYGNYYAKIL